MARHILIKLTMTKYKERILKAAREKQQVTYKGNPMHLTAIFQHKLCRPEGNGRIYLKYWKGKSYNQVPSKDLIQNWWGNKKFYRQAKVKRIQYHQTSFTANVEGTYTVKKYKRRKKIYKINSKQLKKCQ